MDLQSILAANVSEVDMMRIIDLYEQLRRELRLFNDPIVFNTVAPGCNTGWWEVVERLTGTPQDGRSVIAAYELARRRDSIFKWVERVHFAVEAPRSAVPGDGQRRLRAERQRPVDAGHGLPGPVSDHRPQRPAPACLPATRDPPAARADIGVGRADLTIRLGPSGNNLVSRGRANP